MVARILVELMWKGVRCCHLSLVFQIQEQAGQTAYNYIICLSYSVLRAWASWVLHIFLKYNPRSNPSNDCGPQSFRFWSMTSYSLPNKQGLFHACPHISSPFYWWFWSVFLQKSGNILLKLLLAFTCFWSLCMNELHLTNIYDPLIYRFACIQWEDWS